MRNILITIFLFLSVLNFSYSQNSELIDKVLSNLELKKGDCYEKFIRQKELPNSSSESIVIIPKISELNQEEGILIMDTYVLIVEKKTGEINNIFFEKESLFSNAMILENIIIDSTDYKISDKDRAFGIRMKYYGSSRVDPFSYENLSLFITDKEKLKRVLKEYPSYNMNGQTDGNCNGIFEQHKKFITISDNQSNGYYNLKITDSVTISKSTENDCERKVIEEKEKIEFLKYQNGEYKYVL